MSQQADVELQPTEPGTYGTPVVSSSNAPPTSESDSDSETTSRTAVRDPNEYVRKYSDYTMSLLLPVSLTMVIVIWAINTFTPLVLPQDQQVQYLVYHEKPSDTASKKFSGALLNALVIIAAFVVITFLLVCLYKYRCYKVIAGWFVISSFFLLWSMGWMWFDLFCVAYQIPYDLVTAQVILWNFAVVGILSIYWRGAKFLTQGYLIAVSCMMGWFLSRLPEWTTWVVLAFVAVYDVIAVLTPKGPLKMLVEESQKRNEPIPGLVYESKSYKLGLGDFVFYSVLVGRAAMYFYVTWAVCFLAVLMGLCATLFCLGIFRKALPALPISIALGIVFYFLTRFVMVPFMVDLTLTQRWL
eukprot:TRINITY_DN1922_c0_g1_i1.p1 TRINITY_DN1922_c0_g1~~TRINITY_DN1922_c0_g1_i1.p1  ORF type:complete len:356 (-),score=35.50 TRINITY_DN1922_c0_g1_i1:94-1161(-)